MLTHGHVRLPWAAGASADERQAPQSLTRRQASHRAPSAVGSAGGRCLTASTGRDARRTSGTNFRVAIAGASLLLAIAAAPVAAHAPMVVEPGNESPATAFVLEDPTLSRAIGATLDAPGEVDWYRMDLRAGEALVVEVTAPDAAGGIPTSFVVLGPGLPAPPSDESAALATAAGAEGAVAHGAEGGERQVHGGLGFIAWRRPHDRRRGRHLLGLGPRGRRRGRPASTCWRPGSAKSSGPKPSAGWRTSSHSSTPRGRRSRARALPPMVLATRWARWRSSLRVSSPAACWWQGCAGANRLNNQPDTASRSLPSGRIVYRLDGSSVAWYAPRSDVVNTIRSSEYGDACPGSPSHGVDSEPVPARTASRTGLAGKEVGGRERHRDVGPDRVAGVARIPGIRRDLEREPGVRQRDRLASAEEVVRSGRRGLADEDGLRLLVEQ